VTPEIYNVNKDLFKLKYSKAYFSNYAKARLL
jgi:hypothetical protein